MYTISYVINFAISPDLKMERVNIEHSLGHSLNNLIAIDYLTRD